MRKSILHTTFLVITWLFIAGCATSLPKATREGDIKKVQKYIETRHNIDETDKAGHTALWYAANLGHTEIVKLLVNNGAQISLSNQECDSPFHRAIINNHIDIVLFLLDRNVDINSKCKRREQRAITVDKNSGYVVNSFVETVVTPLSLAVEQGHLKIVDILIERGAKVNEMLTSKVLLTNNIHTTTALEIAEKNGHTQIAELLQGAGGEKPSLRISPVPQKKQIPTTESFTTTKSWRTHKNEIDKAKQKIIERIKYEVESNESLDQIQRIRLKEAYSTILQVEFLEVRTRYSADSETNEYITALNIIGLMTKYGHGVETVQINNGSGNRIITIDYEQNEEGKWVATKFW